MRDRPRSRAGRAVACSPPTGTSRASATSPSRAATTASTPRRRSIYTHPRPQRPDGALFPGRGASRRRSWRRIAPHPTRHVPYTRGQSPDRNDPGAVTLPPPEMLGIKPPVVAENDERSAGTSRRTWQPTATPAPTASTTDLKLDPSADPDRFAITEPEAPTATATDSTSAPPAGRPPRLRGASGEPAGRRCRSWRRSRRSRQRMVFTCADHRYLDLICASRTPAPSRRDGR